MSSQPVSSVESSFNPVMFRTPTEEPQPRPAFLMCPPRLYEVDYVINPWMSGNVHGASRERAAAQWQVLYKALSQNAEILLVEPAPGSPDMVFTANAGLERNGTVVLSSFFHPERQGEEPHFRRWFQSAGYTVIALPRVTPFEGEGDALFAETSSGSRLFAGYGQRTSISSHQALRKAWDIPVISLELIDPRFYHLDTCFAPLAGGYVMYYPQAFTAASITVIQTIYPADKRVEVQEADALRFACNAINIGQDIILNRIGRELTANLESLDFQVTQVDLGEFLKAGGAAKCLVMKLGPSQP
jgi:N-dimethylarginine dimethylaminohydrolase